MYNQTISVPDMKQENQRKGGHWFDPKSMRFFSSKVESDGFRVPLKGQDKDEGIFLFLSSERPPGGRERRKWSVRMFKLESGQVQTIGPFHLMTKSQAKEAFEILRNVESLEKLVTFDRETRMSVEFLSVRRKLAEVSK